MNILYLIIVGGLLLIALNIAIYGHLKDIENCKLGGWASFILIVFFGLGIIGSSCPVGKDITTLLEPGKIFCDSSLVVYVAEDSVSLVSFFADNVRRPQSYVVRKVQGCNVWGLEIHAPKYAIVKRDKP